VVFSLIKESVCSECRVELPRSALLSVEGDRALCLSCADLDHLVFLPTGNTALTRRATRQSGLRRVVVRFSRVRKRYERQGVLVERQGLERAEAECFGDEEARAARRGREAARRQALDRRYVEEFARKPQAIKLAVKPRAGAKGDVLDCPDRRVRWSEAGLARREARVWRRTSVRSVG
jgi:hypothetical protein